MKIQLLTLGHKAPGWVQEGYQTYASRLRGDVELELVELAAPKHHKDRRKGLREEAAALARYVNSADWIVALSERAPMLDSRGLATRLEAWQAQGKCVKLLIGGADGLADEILVRADEQLSLSKLTFPHQLVRVIVAEALYRAWSISRKHPYHRD